MSTIAFEEKRESLLKQARDILGTMSIKPYDHIKLSIVCSLIAEANGFDNTLKEKLTIMARLMLVITELDEAMDFYTSNEGDPLEEEIADAAIRLFQIALDINENHSWNFRYTETPQSMAKDREPLEKQLWETIHYVSLAAESWRHDKWDDIQISVELAIASLFKVAQSFDFDLFSEMINKCYKNSYRPFKHGKKQST
jgi:hypothetical protein